MKRFALALALLAAPAGAQSTPYTTSGIFACAVSAYASGTCTAAGNTITLTNGGGTSTMTFAGTAGTLAAGFVPIGSIVTVVTGPFSFPVLSTPADPIFTFALTFNTAAASRTFQNAFVNTGGSFMVSTTTPNPLLIPFGGIQFRLSPNNNQLIVVLAESNTTNPRVNVAIVTPEPSSLALLAPGLFGLVGVLRRRRA